MKHILISIICLLLLTGCINVTIESDDTSTDISTDTTAEESIWPDSGLSQLIPEYQGEGEILNDDDYSFVIEIYNVSDDEYNTYVEECKEAGFNQYTDYDTYDDYEEFIGKNTNGYLVKLEHYLKKTDHEINSLVIVVKEYEG